MAKLKEALWLNRYMLDLFGVKDFKVLSDDLKNTDEGYDEQNRSHINKQLQIKLYGSEALTIEQLIEYDENINRHTKDISRHRNEPIQWKYFQYLALLFTEIYLDKYFRDAKGLQEDLNSTQERFFNNVAVNTEGGSDLFGEVIAVAPKKKAKKGMAGKADFELSPFQLDNEKNDLNKIAFWNATGSGKTLLMHVNILQYRHYLKKAGKENELNRIIVLTPNEGLSRQHLVEFAMSGMEAEMFSKTTTGNTLRLQQIEIIDINKFGDKAGPKTMAIDAFESNNLVLVDEGHRGSSGDTWFRYRTALSRTGFSFEYSATFGQAVGTKPELLNEYGKSVLFDYSYKYFYEDGYGKDYQILNLNDEHDKRRQLYLTACILQFYEQIRYFEQYRNELRPFNIEKPLAIFVGGTVNAVRTKDGKKESDVISILKFLNRFVKNENNETNQLIQRVLNEPDALVDTLGNTIMGGKLPYLKTLKNGETFSFEDILKSVFHAPTLAPLILDNLKGQEGEIGLRIGSGEYFGVINVGDDADLLKLCETNGLMTSVREFSDSLFRRINIEGSTVNMLIGSKKFTEGWSSWRVSTMGLMNIGKGEGSEIIQLFGRGVRLKGYNMSLKRSTAQKNELPRELLNKVKYLPLLETLNIFGLKATYMEQFKQYLEEEGVPKNDGTDNVEKIILPVLPTFDWTDGPKLKYLKVKDGVSFKKTKVIELTSTRKFSGTVQLDWYPRVQRFGEKSRSKTELDSTKARTLRESNLAFLDWNEIWLSIQQFKAERGWYNFKIARQTLTDAMYDAAQRGAKGMETWYRLLIPEAELALKDFKQVAEWQEITIRLLRGYCEKSYNFEQNDFLKDKMEVAELKPNHDNFFDEYQIQVQRDHALSNNFISKLQELKAQLEQKTFRKNFDIGNDFTALYFAQHLYQPLMYLDSKKYKDIVQLQPVALNNGEQQFVKDLRRYHETHKTFFEGKDLYLLRNASRKGIGFFEANNFYPDFILWLFDKDKQHICFIDPKGIHHLGSLEHEKLKLHNKLKNDIEPKLSDDSVSLHAYIVATTEFDKVLWKQDLSMTDFNQNHVYFQLDQNPTYIGDILLGIV